MAVIYRKPHYSEAYYNKVEFFLKIEMEVTMSEHPFSQVVVHIMRLQLLLT